MTETGDGDGTNPFVMPPQSELFWLTGPPEGTERPREVDVRIWDKTTQASRNMGIKKIRDEDVPMAPVPRSKLEAIQAVAAANMGVLDKHIPEPAFLTNIATKPAVGLADPLADDERDLRRYVERKREVFLLHMAVDVKKAEKVRLDDVARQREEALTKSQAVLDADARKFEEYLQSRITRAQQAMREAEAQTKKKQEKLQRIKQLKLDIASVESETEKLKEIREEHSRYKDFLDKLTPLEWKESQIAIKQARKAQRRETWVLERTQAALQKLEVEERLGGNASAEDDTAGESSRKRRGKKQRKEEEEEKERERQAKQKRLQRRRASVERRVAGEYDEVSSEEELELFFKEPKQLMEILIELEGKNLQLIQSLQETEQLLDELQGRLDNTRRDVGTRVKALKENMDQLHNSISQEQKRGKELKQRFDEKASTQIQDRKLADLSQQVQSVYVRCGLSTDHDPNTLQMLAAIEAKLEEMLTGLDEVHQQDVEIVVRLEKEKEKNRRERLREEKFKEQAQKQEERLHNSLQRSQAPVHKKTGKQVMFRSPPLRQERKVVKDTSEDEANARDFQLFQMYIDRKTQKPVTEPPEIEEPKRSLRGPLSPKASNSSTG
mmetsp:Transcript_16806/g.38947  ORF Transcript_16806/g.38947 Transcript_16806/m.38947 type:complete len:611 (+) Transcript_16806:134-1966(+)